ncbi:RNA-binding protein [Roseicitreum antarcticum]|uniref:YlxR domain-containing protein n=1 Tax=Roseicitreum antarcticum TaxID=564137 RepID=A0A1H2R2B7_9RHOB|nr:RNA-binding protein [Roseicitreum antarcticum]SDW13527.1 hypothetical protein SAMN04488238_101171 [Roseicitreum antarcticum]
MTRSGGKTRPETPERRCIVTGDAQPAAGLVRFVLGPDNMIVPDLAQKLPGRGIWVSADRGALDLAVAKKLFARAARQQVVVPDDLPGMVHDLLTRRVIDLISLARRGGGAVAGYEKVREKLMAGTARVLLQAVDGSDRGKAKLRPPDDTGQFIGILTASELGLAFGRDHVIHAALGSGGLTTRVVEEAARLAGVRGQIGGSATGKDMTDA